MVADHEGLYSVQKRMKWCSWRLGNEFFHHHLSMMESLCGDANRLVVSLDFQRLCVYMISLSFLIAVCLLNLENLVSVAFVAELSKFITRFCRLVSRTAKLCFQSNFYKSRNLNN